MKSRLNIFITIIGNIFCMNALMGQGCPDFQVRWLSSQGLFIMDWSTDNAAQTMLSNTSSITVTNGCAQANNGNYPCNVPTYLNDTKPNTDFQIQNGAGTNRRIRPNDNTLWSNGNNNNSGFSGTVQFNLINSTNVKCGYVNAALNCTNIGYRNGNQCYDNLVDALNSTNSNAIYAYVNIPDADITIPTGKTLNLETGSNLGSYTTLTNNGTIILNGGTFINEGTYKGSGVFNGSFINNGTVKPGN